MFKLKTLSKYKSCDWKASRWYCNRSYTAHFERIKSSFSLFLDEGELEAFEKLYRSRKESMKRYRKYLYSMFDSYYELYWLSFTIDEKHYNKTYRGKPINFDRIIRAWCKENCKDYLVNKDYGAKNGRMHYHGVCALRSLYVSWPYGHIDTELINIRGGADRLSKYANKLSNHAVKDGTMKWFHPRGFKEIEKLDIFL